GVGENRWPLERELQLVRELFALHRLRDPGLFTVLEKVANATIQIPPMSLLTLAENAVKHGPAAGHRGQILLEVHRREGGVLIALENPGPFGGPREGSAGLPTLQRRLELAYGGRARLQVAPARDNRTRAEVWIPGDEP